jgi:hypothetical protein
MNNAPVSPGAPKPCEGDNGCILSLSLILVGTSRCDVPARAERAELEFSGISAFSVAPLHAARTAPRAVPTYEWCGCQVTPAVTRRLTLVMTRPVAGPILKKTVVVIAGIKIEMKKTLTALAAVLLSVSALAANEKPSATGTNLTPDQIEANYSQAIEGRTADILKVLGLSDTNQSAKVHDLILAQYRALRAWHDANDAKLKAAKGDINAVAQIRSSLKVLHDQFIAGLSASLAPEQVEQVKDKMTYGKVQFTYAGYLVAYPDLAEPHKQKILELLKQAREEAMDGGSAEEKTAAFQKCKGKINNYLSKEGIHPNKSKPAAKPPADQ